MNYKLKQKYIRSGNKHKYKFLRVKLRFFFHKIYPIQKHIKQQNSKEIKIKYNYVKKIWRCVQKKNKQIPTY